MNYDLDLTSPVPIFRQIVSQVRLKLAQGKLLPGDKLPSVRELALELEVNPNTVQSAYRELLHEGLARTQKGVGLFIDEGVEALARDEKIRQLENKLKETLEFGLSLGWSREEIMAAAAAYFGGDAE